MSKQIDQIQKVNYAQIKEALQTFYQKHQVIMTEEMGQELFEIIDIVDNESRNLQDIKELFYKIGSKM
ncbi:hypothetical protein P8881_19415 [Bacillus haynesii]|uniref:hypothetical protein n=1 Tax=Bacillus haynesii TaxID=1925021 RepID=UPI00228201F6|nr:hypothetical protein [Bacillus haynesii]MCY8737591.1 hypothetical protein [Bacillus haynesii]MEC0709695.1 hypothetical protein [Bacillus haynesii]MEC0739471.1 hypothetical protein [Bacillus haynesii]